MNSPKLDFDYADYHDSIIISSRWARLIGSTFADDFMLFFAAAVHRCFTRLNLNRMAGTNKLFSPI